MRSFVVTNVDFDPVRRKPGSVTITIFDREGVKMIELNQIPGFLFPEDIKIGDSVFFIQKEKVINLPPTVQG